MRSSRRKDALLSCGGSASRGGISNVRPSGQHPLLDTRHAAPAAVMLVLYESPHPKIPCRIVIIAPCRCCHEVCPGGVGRRVPGKRRAGGRRHAQSGRRARQHKPDGGKDSHTVGRLRGPRRQTGGWHARHHLWKGDPIRGGRAEVGADHGGHVHGADLCGGGDTQESGNRGPETGAVAHLRQPHPRWA